MKSKKYSKELKLEVIRRYLEGESLIKLMKEFEISSYNVAKNWIKKYENGERDFKENRGTATKTIAPTKGRKNNINRKNMTDAEYIKYLEMEIDVIKKILEVEASPKKFLNNSVEVVTILKNKYPITWLCARLGISTSTFYNRINDNEIRINYEISELIIKINKSNSALGYRSIKRLLQKRYAINISFNKVRRIMMILGLKGKQARRKYMFKNNIKRSVTYDNILKRDFKAQNSNEKWSIDITYVPNKTNNSYLVCIKDLFDKRIVSYENSNNMSETFVLKCVEKALVHNKISEKNNLILHSDQGSHFQSNKYQKLLTKFGVNGSHSRKGNCHDNAPIESFFSIFKREAFNFEMPKDYFETILKTKNYIEFYNNERVQGGLNEKTPIEYASI